MILDLAKLFNVKEGDLFNIKSSNLPDEYKNTDFLIRDNRLFILNNGEEIPSILRLNDINWNDFSITKSDICKKIKLSKQELYILKLLYEHTELRYITKDYDEIWLFEDKPYLSKELGKLYWDVENGTSETTCIDGNILFNILESLPKYTCINIEDYINEFANLTIFNEIDFVSYIKRPEEMEFRFV